ncbi:MAG: creatininase [Sulfobacillus acidophilus]|uniref:Creatininase n=1 Tax=Sulfobacillus acidophilus TaxID=53633 RepID=A0A2T2WDH1_9FIRM|nr:MAG: creatininase [Sulfobacillus acidophilus]
MYWDRLTTKHFREKVLGQIDTAILPVGSVEAHGEHCPLGTDNMAPWHFAAALEERFPDRVLIMPAIPYGHTWELANYAGTLSVATNAFAQYVTEVGLAALTWGIHNIVLMNGHGGNTPALNAVMENIAEHGGRAVLVNWWIDYSQDILTVTKSQGHAGEDETSVMLAVAGSLVRMEDASFNPYQAKYKIKQMGLHEKNLRHATTGDGRGGSREKGEQIIDLVTARLVQLLEDLWSDSLYVRIDEKGGKS